MIRNQTQVGIVGAGPAGLLLSHLLHLGGVESVVLEVRSRAEIEATLRAGVLEQGTVDLLRECGLGERMLREGFVHEGIELLFDGWRHRVDLCELTGGRAITIYPQHEVIRDLVKARLAADGQVMFEVSNVAVRDFDTAQPKLRYERDGALHELSCDYVAGCDGFHGVCRQAVPCGARREYTRNYPFGWFGMLVNAAPYAKELVYAHHERGFSLISTRSPTVQRLYLQCDPVDRIEDWGDERIWAELDERLSTHDGTNLHRGEIFQKGVIAMRSFVTEPMSYGTLHLAGDAAHIVPPTGAKGLNLAVADVQVLATALVERYTSGRMEGLETYSTTALERVWAAEHFSWWMTSLLHRFPDHDPFVHRLQAAELGKIMKSSALQTALAEQYVGAPMPGISGQVAIAHPAGRRPITGRHRRTAEHLPQWTTLKGKA
jgi:p-hydroxybenzoate 3-monooxygenase